MTLAASRLVLATLALLQGDPRYLEDFQFIVDTVRREAAAIRSKKLDWDAIARTFKPRFQTCTNDVDHVRNVMELLATLRDSHSGVLDAKVKGGALPGKFDGLYGGGLWFGWDQGKFVLRGIMREHPLGDSVSPGSVLVAIGDEPAWLVMERERRRVARFLGISSEHSFFASLGNRMLPFGDRRELGLEFMLPDKKRKQVEVARWGPGGKAFYPGEAFLPAGLAWAEGAVSSLVPAPWSKKVGYLCITGGMDDQTTNAFHRAFDALEGLEALVLDCRTAGGGSDAAAWAMNGRFFPGGVSNGRHGRIEATGDWQFGGPVVMLQGELDVSSAETFAWAMTETGRAISVGRATGGWGIIPKRFKCPSGLVDFRIGVNDRPTPIKGIHTEGAGWPPDVLIPFGPRVAALGDPEQHVGMEILRVLAAGVPVDATRSAFRDLFGGDVARFRAFAKQVAARAKGFDGERLAKLVVDDLQAEIALELEMLRIEEPVPDVVGASRRLPALGARARLAGLHFGEVDRAFAALKAELQAQLALRDLEDSRFSAAPEQRRAYLAKHGATRTGRFVRDRLWK
jgi:hypothetical protein